MSSVLPISTCRLHFANDTNLSASGKDLEILKSATNSNLSQIFSWLKVNELPLNIKRTHYMILCRHKKLCHDVKFLIDGQSTDKVLNTTFIRIIIDSEITYKWHVNSLRPSDEYMSVNLSSLVLGSNNGLSPGQHQVIIWTNDGILSIGPLGTNFSEVLIKINIFSLKEMHLKSSSTKWQPFCLSSSVLS